MARSENRKTGATAKQSAAKNAAEEVILPESAEEESPEIEDVAVEEDLDLTSPESVFSIIRDLEQQLDASFTLNEALEQDLTRMTVDRDDLEKRSEKQARQIRQMEEKMPELDTLRDELEFAEQRNAEEQMRIVELTEQIDRLNEEKEQAVTGLEEASHRLKEIKVNHVKLEYQVARLEETNDALDKAQAERDKMRKANQEAENSILQIQSDLKVATAVQKELHGELAAARETIDRLEAQSEGATSEVENLKSGQATYLQHIAQLEKENAAFAARERRLEQDLAKKSDELAKFENNLAASQRTIKDIHTALTSMKPRTRRVIPEQK